MKVLVATEKPFAKKAVDGIRTIVEQAGYELYLRRLQELERDFSDIPYVVEILYEEARLYWSNSSRSARFPMAKSLKKVLAS